MRASVCESADWADRRQRQATVCRAKQPENFVRARQIGSGARFQESGVTGFRFGSLTGASLRASCSRIGADPLGDPEHVFEKAGKATMRSGVAALDLETAAGLLAWRLKVRSEFTYDTGGADINVLA